MILEAIFNGQIYPAETVVPKCKKFRDAGEAVANIMAYFEQKLSKSNGTPSLPDDLFSPSPERYQVNSTRRWSGTTAKNTLSQKECAVTLPSTIPTHRDTIHIAM